MKTQNPNSNKTKTAIPMKGINEWIKTNYQKPEKILGKDGLIAQLTKQVIERALAGELTHHLGYEKGERLKEKSNCKNGDDETSPNCRNGSSGKQLLTENSQMEIAVPRDRAGKL